MAELQLGHFREFKHLRPLRFCFGCLLQAAVKCAQQTFSISTTSFLRLAALIHHAPAHAVHTVPSILQNVCIVDTNQSELLSQKSVKNSSLHQSFGLYTEKQRCVVLYCLF